MKGIMTRRRIQLSLLVCLFNYLVVCAEETTVSLDFVGDIYMGGLVQYQNKHGYCTYNEMFQHVARILRESDLAVGNLEGAFIRRDMEKDEQTQFYPRLGVDGDVDAAVKSLKYAGFDIMTLANNHLNDFKVKPINYTVGVLRKEGIQSFGYTFGHPEEDTPQVPLIVKVKGIKIGFLGYCDVFSENPKDPQQFFLSCVTKRGQLNGGPALYSHEVATRDVNALKDKVDVVVVFMHWGDLLITKRSESQLRDYMHLKQLGVHLIIGCHPHVLQAHTVDKTTFTAFSLGNFVFGPTKLGIDLAGDFYRSRNPSYKAFSKLMTYVNKHPINPSSQSRILRVYITRKGYVSAKYLPLRIGFHPASSMPRCFQSIPIEPKRWISVCSDHDKNCVTFDTSGNTRGW